MKLATLKDGTRDGVLVVVARNLARAAPAEAIAPTLQRALDDWTHCRPALKKLYEALNAGTAAGAFDLQPHRLAAPLPRAYQWLDGSAYLSHVERVRAARGATMPPGATEEPLMYQGGSDSMLGATDDVPVASEDWGIDLEGEVGVITGDVPMAASEAEAATCIRLLVLINDVSLRNLTAAELAKGFGFVNSKSWTAFSPVAVTPEELGEAWDGRTVHLPLEVQVNGARLGAPNAGEDMQFDFPRLIAHAARTRPLGAGTLVGSGTVSNQSRAAGFGCLAEKRAVETVESGKPQTPFLRHGDRVRIEMLDREGRSVFGAIDQKIIGRQTRKGGSP
ncbi:MAG TPA: fumarylacetoacetate hydrolase family protein [Burkholderiales bacterium]|jgi:fumarylacetoacetate (FAA) hydrolase|nr:fumarylacetoacetate hydrolase family protein [Burkholderiales bacterium]HEX2650725.1 fumarylacetoacetate hydrolase family protein [Burkholderiales bacterium]